MEKYWEHHKCFSAGMLMKYWMLYNKHWVLKKKTKALSAQEKKRH